MIPLVENQTSNIAEICRRHRVKRLEVFGSAAVGTFDHEKSDLDFVVDYLPFPQGGKADAYFGLLEDLKILFGRDIDLVVERAIDNPVFRDSVALTKESVYEA